MTTTIETETQSVQKPKRSTKRRGYGEGSIFQRADGRWCATIVVGRNEKGKRIRRTVYGTTKKQAQDRLSGLMQQKGAGTLTGASRETVAEYLGWWLENVAKPSVRPTTFANYKWIIDRHINPRIGGDKLQRLTPLRVQGLDAQMVAEKCSPQFRKMVYSVLRAALNKAVKLERIGRNACAAVGPPKVEETEIHPLDETEWKALLQAASGIRLEALFILAVMSGLRQGEIFGLRWGDIDLDGGQLTVRRALVEISGKLSHGEPKSKSGRRVVTLPAIVVNAFLDHRKAMLAKFGAGAVSESATVFLAPRGGLLRKGNFFNRVWKPLLKAAGLPGVRFHDLRHSHATLCLLLGESLAVVKDRLGHSTISQTMRYAHVVDTMREKTADKLDGLFPKVAVGG